MAKMRHVEKPPFFGFCGTARNPPRRELTCPAAVSTPSTSQHHRSLPDHPLDGTVPQAEVIRDTRTEQFGGCIHSTRARTDVWSPCEDRIIARGARFARTWMWQNVVTRRAYGGQPATLHRMRSNATSPLRDSTVVQVAPHASGEAWEVDVRHEAGGDESASRQATGTTSVSGRPSPTCRRVIGEG